MLAAMSIAITEDHRALADTVRDFLVKHQSRAAARALLEAPAEPNASFYADAADLGWLGLHVPEALGGSGFGLEEVVVVAEELGRGLAPGAFIPTLIASAVLATVPDDAVANRLLPGLADGSTTAAVSLGGAVELRNGALTGAAGTVLGAGLADTLLVAVGDDVAVVDADADGVTVELPPNIDPTRRAGRVTFDEVPAEVIPGARRSADRPGPHDHRRRGGRRGPRVHRPGRRLLQGAPAVRPADRHVPGRQAPLRQHGRGHRAGDGRRVGRRPRRRRWWRPVLVRRGGRRLARRARRRPLRQPRHAGARRHRLHVGARLPHLPAPGDRDRRRPRRRRRRRRRHRPHPPGRAPRAHRRPAAGGRGDPRRGAGVRGVAGRARRGRPQAAPHRRGLRHAALAQAVRARRRRHRAARRRAGVRGGQGPPPAVRHHRLGHPDAHPARHRGAGLAVGATRR